MVRPISTTSYAALANDVYADSRVGSDVLSWRRQALYGNEQNGFYAAVYHSDWNRKTVIAYRGSGGDAGDWTLTGNIGNFLGVRGAASHMNMALDVFRAVAEVVPRAEISVCGHSLGGFLAAMVGLEKNVQAVAFDRPTLGYSAFRVATANHDDLYNFRADFDPVSGIRDGFGRWITVNARVLERIARGAANASLTHSMGHLHSAIRSDSRANRPPSEWR